MGHERQVETGTGRSGWAPRVGLMFPPSGTGCCPTTTAALPSPRHTQCEGHLGSSRVLPSCLAGPGGCSRPSLAPSKPRRTADLQLPFQSFFFLIFRCFLKYLTLNYPGLNVTNTDLPSPAELLLLVLFSDLSLLHVTPVSARSHSTRYMPGSFAAHRPPAPLQAVPGLLWDL